MGRFHTSSLRCNWVSTMVFFYAKLYMYKFSLIFSSYLQHMLFDIQLSKRNNLVNIAVLELLLNFVSIKTNDVVHHYLYTYTPK